jgi:hypothetical protein
MAEPHRTKACGSSFGRPTWPPRSARRILVPATETTRRRIEMTELAHRRNHHFDVALYWNTKRDELFVIVEDIAAGDRFSIAAPRARALDVLNHPFAYTT